MGESLRLPHVAGEGPKQVQFFVCSWAPLKSGFTVQVFNMLNRILPLDGLRPTSDGLQPASDGLQPASDGLQPASDGLQPKSDGLQPTSDGLQPKGDGLINSYAHFADRSHKVTSLGA